MSFKPWNAESVLKECSAILDERGQVYGHADKSFELAADIASKLIGAPLRKHDIALVMLSVKLARMAGSPDHLDSYTDAINYLAFACWFVSETD